MNLQFIQEDERCNVYDESGNEPVEMEVDSEQVLLGDIIDFDNIHGPKIS